MKTAMFLPGALCVLVLGQVVLSGAVRTYPIPEFEEPQWQEEKHERVWVDADMGSVWIPAEIIREWVAPIMRPVWVPPRFIRVPEEVRDEWIPPVTHPVYHELEVGVTPAEGYWQHTDATTIEHPEKSHQEPNPDIEYDYWVEDIQIEFGYTGSYYDEEEDQWYDTYGFYEVDYGWWEHGTRSGGTHTVVEELAWTENIPEKNEWVETAPEKPYVISYPWVEQVEDAPGHWIVVVVTPERDVEVAAGYWGEETEHEGYWVVTTKPGTGIWVPIENSPGHYEDRVTPGQWVTVVVPGSVLDVVDDGQDIVGLSWSTGRPMGVPAFVSDFLSNPEWSLNDEADDADLSVFTPELAFAYAGTLEEELKKQAQNRRQLRNSPGIGWEIIRILDDRRMTAEEAMANAAAYILLAAEEMTKTRVNPRDVMTFMTYEKYENYALRPYNETGPLKVYTGRTAGWGEGDEVLERRERNHRIKRPTFLPPIPNTIIVTRGYSKDAAGATRGREQQIMDYHDLHEQLDPTNIDSPLYTYSRSHSENARPITFSHGMPGVSRSNVRAWDYWVISTFAFLGPVWEYTGFQREPYDPFSWPPQNLLLPPVARFPLTY